MHIDRGHCPAPLEVPIFRLPASSKTLFGPRFAIAQTKTTTIIANCSQSQISRTNATIPRCRGCSIVIVFDLERITTGELSAEPGRLSRASKDKFESLLLRLMVSTIASKAVASRSGTGVDGRAISTLLGFSDGRSVPPNRPSFQCVVRIRIVCDFRRFFSAGVSDLESGGLQRPVL